MDERSAESADSSIPVKPSTDATGLGSERFSSSVSGFASEASRLSTGLITWCLTASTSFSESVP